MACYWMPNGQIMALVTGHGVPYCYVSAHLTSSCYYCVFAGLRQGKGMAGRSQKVGCLYKFDARVYWSNEQEVMITMHQHKHISPDSGQDVCHGPDADTSNNPRLAQAPRLSAALKAHVLALLEMNKNMTPRAVIQGWCQPNVSYMQGAKHLRDYNCRLPAASIPGCMHISLS